VVGYLTKRCQKFTAKTEGERTVKIGWHLAKLKAKIKWHLFPDMVYNTN